MHRPLALISRIIALTVGLGAGSAEAQTRPGSLGPNAFGTIDGVVSDTSLVPMQGAFISILGTSIRVGTGPNGRFRITKIPTGQYLVIVKRVGYRPASAVIEVPSVGHRSPVVRAREGQPKRSRPMTITEKAPTERMSEFEQRRKLGFGEFMTRAEIDQRNSVFPTELFRKFMSVNVSPSRTGPITQWFALSRREGGNPTLGACPMQVYLDRVPLPNPFNLDLLPSPKEITGIEVYAGSATIPPQFNGFNRGCGIILVWTRDGG